MKRLWICGCLFIVLVQWFPVLANTQAETGGDKTLSPYFFIEKGESFLDHFPLKDTRVVVNITGVIAEVTVTQTYANAGPSPINGRYIFPGSTRAAVHGMTMKIGEKVIKAKIKEKTEAQHQFEKAKKEGKTASLLKQQRPNVFSMNVSNIMPGDTIEIELKYTELIIPTEKTYRFVYPTVVGPRYSSMPEAGAPESEQWVKNPYLLKGSPPRSTFDLSLNIATGIPLHELVCRSHEIQTCWDSDSVARITLEENEASGGNRDFILDYRLAGEEIQSGLLLHEGDAENFFLVMMEPPERVLLKDIPPREYVFIVDVSGSMNGFPLNTSKKLLADLIGNLRPTDMFNLIFFAGGSSVMSPESLPATAENIKAALGMIDKQRGGGGTELLKAVKTALSMPSTEGVSRSFIVVTDGYIHTERKTFGFIRQNLNNANVFAFGIGSSVNRYLIEGMAKAGMGEPFIVTKPAEAGSVSEQFRAYVRSPLLTNLELEFLDFDAYDVEPQAIPDLLADRPLVLFGKWRGRPGGSIRAKGNTGTGAWEKTFHVQAGQTLHENPGLPYLWARKRIERLSDYDVGLSNSENRAEVTSLGLTYNLLTRYTSFIAVLEEVRNPNADARDVKQPLPLPQGVSNLAVGGGMVSVPEPELYVLAAFAFLMLFVLYLCRRRNSALR